MRRSAPLVLAAAFAACQGQAPTAPAAAAPGAAAAAAIDQDQRMAWWREARFGMFVHWGLYAIPAGKWGQRTDHGEWIRTTAEIPLADYGQLQAQWRPSGFDADAWVRLAKQAGMGYLVITSKHHDGFCLWDSRATDWDVARTPDGRDVLRALQQACERRGVRFCTYHSIMDWHHPDYLPRRPWERDRSTEGADFARFERYLHTQVQELVQNYRPAVLWFDGEWESTWNHERGVRLFELCRRLDPRLIVNNRVDVHRAGMQGFARSAEAVGDFQTPEQEIPATGVPGVDWESCMTMNSHWGWNAYDTQWKSTTVLLRNLIDIASKGGNYLLNIGPRADGTFPPEAVQRLQEIGAWMATHGEAIVGTTASVFPQLDFGRCTVKRAAATTTLYLHVFDLPADGLLRLPGLKNPLREVRVLGAAGTAAAVVAEPQATPPTQAVRVQLAAPNPHATVVAVQIDGEPVVYAPPGIAAETDEFVHTLAVSLTAGGPGLAVRYTTDGSEPGPDSSLADGPLQLTATTTVRAASFDGAMRASAVVARTFTQVAPLPPVEAVAPRPGLQFTEHLVDWQRIPESRDGWVAVRMGTTDELSAGKEPREHIAVRYTGFVRVPADELYRFRLTSDDGSKLWVSGRLVVDHDGLHGPTPKDGAIALAEGLHPFELVWFNRTGGAELSVQWAVPGRGFEKVPAGVLRH